MKYTLFRRLLTPGAVPEGVAFFGSFFAMAAIFVAEVSTSSSIRMFVLYVLPLAAVGLHCGRHSLHVTSVGIALAFEAFTLIRLHVSPGATLSNLTFEAIVAGTIVLVAIAARTNYLAVVHLSRTDHLTEVANRRAFEGIAALEIARMKRYGGVFSLAVLDLDRFKELNDVEGHHAGDAALKHFTHALLCNTRESDTVARLGGDEFVVLMPNTEVSDCRALCEQFCRTVAGWMGDAGFDVTASIGCATFRQPPESVGAAIARADAALYEAKRAGRNRVVCDEPGD